MLKVGYNYQTQGKPARYLFSPSRGDLIDLNDFIDLEGLGGGTYAAHTQQAIRYFTSQKTRRQLAGLSGIVLRRGSSALGSWPFRFG